MAVHATAVRPNGNGPDGVEQAGTTAPLTVSTAVTVYFTEAPPADVASTVSSSGSFRTGGVVSATVTVKPPLAWFPCASVTVQATCVAPIAKIESGRGAQRGVTTPSTLSVADAV